MIDGSVTNKGGRRLMQYQALFFLSFPNGRGSRVAGRGSRVAGRGSRVLKKSRVFKKLRVFNRMHLFLFKIHSNKFKPDAKTPVLK